MSFDIMIFYLKKLDTKRVTIRSAFSGALSETGKRVLRNFLTLKFDLVKNFTYIGIFAHKKSIPYIKSFSFKNFKLRGLA